MLKRLLSMAVVLGLLVGAGCGGDDDSSGSGSGDGKQEQGPIVIGGALGMTGIYEPYDVMGLNAIKLKVNEINAAGGIDGRKIKIITEDTKSEIPRGAATAQKLLDRGADIMLVSCDFDFGSPSATVAQQAGKLVFSVCAQSPKFGVQGIGDKAFTASISVNAEGAALAAFAQERGFKKPFLLLDTTLAYDHGLCDGFKKGFDGEPAGQATFKNGDASISSQIADIRSSGADSVLLCTYQPGGGSALRQIRSAGVDLPLLAGGSFDGSFWMEGIPDVSNLFVSIQASVFGNDPKEEVNAFVDEYEKTYGDKPLLGYSVVSYSVGEAIVKALEETGGSTDGDALKEALEGFDNEELLVGPTTFDEQTHIELMRPMLILEITKGKPKVVDQVEPAVEVGLAG